MTSSGVVTVRNVNASSNGGSSASSGDGAGQDLLNRFREKVRLMQSWKPGSTPSNRDRLELYAYHKIAVSGNAPSSIPSSASSAEIAKYKAWLSKSGKSQEGAMLAYLQEADRQIRVYGSASAPVRHDDRSSLTTSNDNSARTPQSTPANSSNNALPPSVATPRGLAAIPLLAAAVAESRKAYLRRLSQTTLETAWWKRQESLCAPPGSIVAFPETILLHVARFIEFITLTPAVDVGSGRNILASFCWPIQKCLLSLWMVTILYITTIRSSLNVCGIVVWGSRRTGLSLNREYSEIIALVAHSIKVMCEPNQPLTCRLTGVVLLPFATLITVINRNISNITLASCSMICITAVTWWYWCLTVPFLLSCLLWTAFSVGFCFALIELAGI